MNKFNKYIKRKLGLTSYKNAKKTLSKAGLPFPYIPASLQSKIKERSDWVYSSTRLTYSPYALLDYTQEIHEYTGNDYVVLAHSGYGANSHAIQFYLIHQNLALFLFLGWGGIYMDNHEKTDNINQCFKIAEKITKLLEGSNQFPKNQRMIIVGSDFYGSYWYKPKDKISQTYTYMSPTDLLNAPSPSEILTEALNWLKTEN